MVFSSTIFVFLWLPITLLGYYLIKKEFKNIFLLCVSLLFFGWSQPNYIWLIFLNIIINYYSAIIIDDLQTQSIKRKFLFLSIFLNLLLLFYFKYFNFFIEIINRIFTLKIGLKNIVLPIGISFFTFQGISYVVDVYRKDVPTQKSIIRLALYICLFPQLIAGPIVRYKDLSKEIDYRENNLNSIVNGIQRFIVGISKKTIIANTAAEIADSIWINNPQNISTPVVWLGCLAYTLQIYYDFSGYSDMAIGLGQMFGFHFGENFDYPYASNSVSEFWRRWHISLSSWFRDYVYIPLGGNRKNVYINLFVVFLLTGLWHGASWHYVVWGVWNGFFVILERLLVKSRNNDQNTIICFLNKLYSLFVVCVGWIIFRSPSIKYAFNYLLNMFGLLRPEKYGFTVFWYLNKWNVLCLVLGVLFSFNTKGMLIKALKNKMNNNLYLILKYVFLLLLFYLSIMRIVSGTYNPFIYFQF